MPAFPHACGRGRGCRGQGADPTRIIHQTGRDGWSMILIIQFLNTDVCHVFRPSTEWCIIPPHPWLFTFRCIMVSCRRLACWLWGGAPTPPLTPMGFAPRYIETTQHCKCSSSNNNVIHFALRQVSMSSHYVELKVYSWDVRQTEGMRIQLHLVWNLLFVNTTTAATWDILFSK